MQQTCKLGIDANSLVLLNYFLKKSQIHQIVCIRFSLFFQLSPKQLFSKSMFNFGYSYIL